jgi:hypothetical protein
MPARKQTTPTAGRYILVHNIWKQHGKGLAEPESMAAFINFANVTFISSMDQRHDELSRVPVNCHVFQFVPFVEMKGHNYKQFRVDEKRNSIAFRVYVAHPWGR